MKGKIQVVIGGINGKMGIASAKAILDSKQFELVGAFGKTTSNYIGLDLCKLLSLPLETGVLVSNGLLDLLPKIKSDVYLDFTQAEAAFENAKVAIGHGVRPVIGTSGLPESQVKILSELANAKKVGCMLVPNFSIGAVLMMEFAKMASKQYANVEIVEMHHTKKIDAPSGTAMHTASKLASGGSTFNKAEVKEHEILAGSRGGANTSGVRIHSIRLPGLISHQEVIFGADGELLTIKHDSYNTNCFMKGILLALKNVMQMNRFVVGLENILELT